MFGLRSGEIIILVLIAVVIGVVAYRRYQKSSGKGKAAEGAVASGPRFCPACGTKIENATAQFCPKCGAAVPQAAPAASVARPSKHQAAPATGAPTGGSAGGFPAIAIVPIALAVLAIVFSCQPWFKTSSSAMTSSSIASGGMNFLSGLAGDDTDYSGMAFRETYSPWEFPQLGQAIDQYSELTDQLSDLSSYSDSGRSHAVAIANPDADNVGQLFSLLMLLWGAGVALSAIGIIRALMSPWGRKVLLAFGGAVLAACAFAFSGIVGSSNGWGAATGSVMICGILGVATALCSLFLVASRRA